jgi:hypothetical protein
MPYIEQKDREPFEDFIKENSEKSLIDSIPNCLKLAEEKDLGVGELNYIVTTLCVNFLKESGMRYSNIDYAMRVLEINKPEKTNKYLGTWACIKMEFYILYARPYEDVKKFENGDVC